MAKSPTWGLAVSGNTVAVDGRSFAHLINPNAAAVLGLHLAGVVFRLSQLTTSLSLSHCSSIQQQKAAHQGHAAGFKLVEAWYSRILAPRLFPPTSLTPTWDKAISTSFSTALGFSGFAALGSGVEFFLDADGKLGKDGTWPLFDFNPSSFRIDCHMGLSHCITNCTSADQYPSS